MDSSPRVNTVVEARIVASASHWIEPGCSSSTYCTVLADMETSRVRYLRVEKLIIMTDRIVLTSVASAAAAIGVALPSDSFGCRIFSSFSLFHPAGDRKLDLGSDSCSHLVHPVGTWSQTNSLETRRESCSVA